MIIIFSTLPFNEFTKYREGVRGDPTIVVFKLGDHWPRYEFILDSNT